MLGATEKIPPLNSNFIKPKNNFLSKEKWSLFEMMENGCLISKGELFYTLQQLRDRRSSEED